MAQKGYTLEEVSRHNNESECWIIINGKVLDVTKFLPAHPGGAAAILRYAGKDGSEDFNMLHAPDVIQKHAPDAVIGVLKAGDAKSTSAPVASAAVPASVSKRREGKGLQHWSQPNNPIALHALQQATPSSTPSRNSGGTKDILVNERKKTTFEIEKMTNILDGGPKKTARRRFILSPGKDIDVSDKYLMDRPEVVREHVKHFIGIHGPFAGTFIPTREDATWMQENAMISGSLMNHYGLFMPTILSQSNDDQVGWWLPRAAMFSIIGCYAQTELGHGSNVRGLQTTAHYDVKAQEFVLNTPTLLSIKWWPGALGKLATHALVYAQLVLEGKEYGVHIFMVQIRDEDHRPLPGIELGDVGPKLGDAGNDTGFMRLDNVRIPREHMLAKYQQVTPEGKYVKAAQKTNDKLHYATMMFTRGAMVRGAGGMLARAVTIAVRYGCIRKQGFVDGASVSYAAEERQIIDHQVQRYRLFKQLALAYAMKFCGKWMVEKFAALEGGGIGVIVDTSQLGEIAATSAGLKGLCTFLAAQGIEDCRKCCGGNGYLLSSGVAQLAADYVWQTTAEGDWIILMLQTARFLLKQLQDAKKGGLSPTGPTSYLIPLKDPSFDLKKAAPVPAKSHKDFLNSNHLLKLYKYRALVQVIHAGANLEAAVAKGVKYDDAWNAASLELCNLVVSHCHAFILDNFITMINDVEDEKCKVALSRLCQLYACTELLDGGWAGFLGIEQVYLIREAVGELLDILRPDAVGLVDAFEFPDRVLGSTLGRYDGNVYEALYEAAKKSHLNQTDPFDGYEEFLKPKLDLELLKVRNGRIPSHL
jgi:acyl-CoA oxidase